ncbi:MAG: nucleotide exchange factor GrpE [Acidimicrobiia bacterium]|nr:nucleotide exchange factor GrpE [Acidimicrobiia bacterium]
MDEPIEATGDAEAEYADDVTRERDELVEQLRRVQADFENFRKRTQREQAERAQRATEGLLETLLPVLDNFELALVGMEDAPETANVRKGVELVYAEFLGALEKAGLERIAADGSTFDPNEHEAVMTVERDAEGDGGGETVVAETVRTGYRLKGRVLRPAMVKVAR